MSVRAFRHEGGNQLLRDFVKRMITINEDRKNTGFGERASSRTGNLLTGDQENALNEFTTALLVTNKQLT